MLKDIFNFKMRIFPEVGGVSGFLTTLGLKSEDVQASAADVVNFNTDDYKTILLAFLGGVAGAVGGLIVALVLAWAKKKYKIGIDDKPKV